MTRSLLNGSSILDRMMKQKLMDDERGLEREDYYITSASLASHNITDKALKTAVVEEVNMVVDILFYFIKSI